MSALHLAVPSALGAAACFGYAAAIQHDESGQVERRGALNPGLLGLLARRSRWWLGIAADLLAVVLQLIALRYGPVALVQPLLVAGLPIAVVLSCAVQHRPIRQRDLLGIVVCGAGICLVTVATRDADAAAPIAHGAALAAALSCVIVVLVLLGVARVRPGAAGVTTGAAAGLATGAGSVLLAVCAARIDDPLRLLSGIVPYAAIVVGLVGLLLTQAAFQTGSIAAPLATLSLVEPASAIVLAAVVLRQSLPSSSLAMTAVGLGVVLGGAGIAVLAAAPSLAPTTQRKLEDSER